MTFVNDDKVEVVLWVFAKIWRVVGTTHEGLEDGEEDAPIGGDAPVLADRVGADADERIIGESGVARELSKGLVGENVPVCQKQDAGSA